MSNKIGTMSQIKGYLGKSEVKATYFQNIPTYIKAPIIDTSAITKIKAKGVYELGGRLELYDTSTSPLVSRVDITSSDWCDLTPNPGNLNKGINLFTVQQAIVYNNVEYKSEVTNVSRTVYEIQRVSCSGGTVTWSRQEGGIYLNTIKAFAGELVYWKVTPDSTHRIPSGYSDHGSVELLSSNFDINAAGNATYTGSAICTQCEQIRFTITLTKSGTGADDASWTNSSGSINSVEAVKGDTIGTMSNNTIIIYIGETSTPRHTLTFSITESEGYSYSTTYIIPSVASIQEPLTFSAAVTKTIKQYTMTFSKIGTGFNWNNSSSLLVDHGTLCSFIGGTATFGEVTRTLSGSKTGYDPIFSITRNPSTDRLWRANSNLSLIGNVTWQPQDCDINIKINTGISKIYYKVNGASVYSYVNTDSTITAKYDSEVRWYAVCEEGYEGTGLGSAANPNSFTMGLEAQIRPTATRQTFTLSLAVATAGTGSWATPSTTTIEYGDIMLVHHNILIINCWDAPSTQRLTVQFSPVSQTGYNTNISYDNPVEVQSDVAVTATVTYTPKSYPITITKNTGISTISYKVNGSSNWSTTSESTTINANYNSMVQWYATPTIEYLNTGLGTSSAPNSFTMGTSGIINPQPVRKSFTITFGLAGSGYGSWSKNSIIAFYGDEIVRVNNAIRVFEYDDTTHKRDESVFTNGSETGYTYLVSYTEVSTPVTSDQTINATTSRDRNSFYVNFTSSDAFGTWSTSSIKAYYGDWIQLNENNNTVTIYKYDATSTPRGSSALSQEGAREYNYTTTYTNAPTTKTQIFATRTVNASTTKMRKEYTVTFTRSGESTGTGWSKSTATAQHGDNFYRAEDSNVVKIKQWDDNTQFRDESTFNYGTKTGYNLSVNYTFTNPITYNTTVNAEVVATPIPYLIRFSKGTGISSIKYRTSSSAAFVEAPNSTFIDYNTTIQWYADVSSGYTGNNTGSSSSPNSVTVTGATTISATTTVNKYSLTLTKNSNVASLSYRVGSSGNYTTVTSTTTVANIDFNSALYLYATAATGYSVPNTVSNPVETAMPVNGYTYSPTATINKHSLVLTMGSNVSSISYKIGTSSTYTTVSSNTTVPNVNYNSQIQLYATPITGYSVPNPSTNPLTINLPDADYTYQPTATPKNYTLTLTKNANIASLSYRVNGASTYTTVSATTTISNIPYDSQMSLYATPNTGYSTPNSSSANPLYVRMGEGYSYSPVATAKTYFVNGQCTNGSVKWSNSETGTYSIGIEATYGSTIYWKVTASSGYEAPSPASGSVVLNNTNFTITEDPVQATYNTTFVCTAKTYTIRQYSPNGGSLYWGTSSIASSGGTATLSREFGKKVYWRIDADRGYDRPSTYYGDLTFNTTNFNLSGSNADLKSGIVDDCVGKTEYILQVERLNSSYYTHSVSVGGVSLDSGGTVYQGERISCSATAKTSSISPSSLSAPTFTVNSPSKITVYNSNSISVTCYYSTTSGGTTSNVTIPASGSKQITGLTANTTYYFFFRGNATQTDYQVKINNGEYGNTASTTVLIAGNTTVTFNGKANTSTVSMDSSVASAKTQTKSYATITFGLTGSYASEYTGTLTLTENNVIKKTMQVTNGVISSNTYSGTVNEEYKLVTETVTIGSSTYSADTVTLTPTSTSPQTMNASITKSGSGTCPSQLCIKNAGYSN